MSALSIRVSEKEKELISNYAKLNNVSISKIIKDTLLEKIEEEFDLKLYEESYQEYLDDPVTYSLEEVADELGIKL